MTQIQTLPKKLRTIILVIITCLVVGSVGWLWHWWRRGSQTLSGYLLAQPDYSYVQAKIKGRGMRLELVNTDRSIQQGLSDRETIGSDGMLFVMPARGIYPFWMPRMYFDLDILWLDEDEIVDITANVPAPPLETPLAQLALYTSSRPANLVLEIPAGRAKLLDIQIGDRLEVTRK